MNVEELAKKLVNLNSQIFQTISESGIQTRELEDWKILSNGSSTLDLVVTTIISPFDKWNTDSSNLKRNLLYNNNTIEEESNMATVKLVRYVFALEDNASVDDVMKELLAAGVREVTHYPTLGVLDGYYKNRKRKELEEIVGVAAASTNIPSLSREDSSDE